jgi:hypothetical protein
MEHNASGARSKADVTERLQLFVQQTSGTPKNRPTIKSEVLNLTLLLKVETEKNKSIYDSRTEDKEITK